MACPMRSFWRQLMACRFPGVQSWRSCGSHVDVASEQPRRIHAWFLPAGDDAVPNLALGLAMLHELENGDKVPLSLSVCLPFWLCLSRSSSLALLLSPSLSLCLPLSLHARERHQLLGSVRKDSASSCSASVNVSATGTGSGSCPLDLHVFPETCRPRWRTVFACCTECNYVHAAVHG